MRSVVLLSLQSLELTFKAGLLNSGTFQVFSAPEAAAGVMRKRSEMSDGGVLSLQQVVQGLTFLSFPHY